MSDIGLPNGLSRDNAYIAGVADGENHVLKLLKEEHGFFYGNDDLLHCDCGWVGEQPFLGNQAYWDHIEKVL